VVRYGLFGCAWLRRVTMDELDFGSSSKHARMDTFASLVPA